VCCDASKVGLGGVLMQNRQVVTYVEGEKNTRRGRGLNCGFFFFSPKTEFTVQNLIEFNF